MTLSGSSVYRAEGIKEDDRGRDRSPLRPEERESEDYSQPDPKKQKLTFGFGKKSGNEQKKGIQIKLGSASVSKTYFIYKYKDSFSSKIQFLYEITFFL